MDSAASHISERVKKAVREAHTTPAVLPGGCT
eukprot:gene27002-biopygen17572